MKHSQISGKILKSYYDVFNALGYGFSEKVYEKAMLNNLKRNGLNVINQYPIKIYYFDNIVGEYIADIIVENKIIVELKTVKKLIIQHECQLLNYLNATKYEVGLLLNFGLEVDTKRKVYDNPRKTYFQSKDAIMKPKSNDIYDKIINAFHKVYMYFGFGFQESVYRNAFEIELKNSGIDIKRHLPLAVLYMEENIGEYFSEFYTNNLLIKIISKSQITLNDEKIIVNILKNTNTKEGLILNFGTKPEVKKKFKDRKNDVHGSI